ncbi:MAG: SPOR domain-containing protein [Nevskiales bacterium]
MGNNYAKRGDGKKDGNRGMPGWVWAFVGLTAGLLVATALYLRSPLPQSGRALPDEEAEVEPEDDSRFDFYEMLPNYEVKIPGGPANNPPPPDPTQAPGAYVIQAGSFRTFEDADRLKASMAMLGVESHIEKAAPDTNGHTWYRVRTSPEKNQAVVNEQLRLLRENRIDGVLIKAN